MDARRLAQLSRAAGSLNDCGDFHAQEVGMTNTVRSTQMLAWPAHAIAGWANMCAMIDPAQLGKRIALARKASNLKQADLAAAMEIGRSHLANVERGHDTVGAKPLYLIATETGVSLDWLLGLRGTDNTVIRRDAQSDPQAPNKPDEIELLSLWVGLKSHIKAAILTIAIENAGEIAKTPRPKFIQPDNIALTHPTPHETQPRPLSTRRNATKRNP